MRTTADGQSRPQAAPGDAAAAPTADRHRRPAPRRPPATSRTQSAAGGRSTRRRPATRGDRGQGHEGNGRRRAEDRGAEAAPPLPLDAARPRSTAGRPCSRPTTGSRARSRRCSRTRSRGCPPRGPRRRARSTSRSWGSWPWASRRSASASTASAPTWAARPRCTSATCSATTTSRVGAGDRRGAGHRRPGDLQQPHHRFDWAVGRLTSRTCTRATSRRARGLRGRPAIVDSYKLFRRRTLRCSRSGRTRSRAPTASRCRRRRAASASARRCARRRTTTPAGEYLGDEKQNVDSGYKPLYMGSFSGALVHDTSVFGATSPILGTRGRLEAARRSARCTTRTCWPTGAATSCPCGR